MSKRRWARSSEPELLTPAQFLALPAQPDGTIVRILADVTNGIVWTFRYRAASASAYKWECIGATGRFRGSVLGSSGVLGSGSGYSEISGGAGPDVIPPLSGDYDVIFAAIGYNPTAAPSIINLGVGITGSGGPGSAPGVTVSMGSAGGNQYGQGAANEVLTGLVAGTAVRMRYLYTASTVTAYGERRVSIAPIRVQGP
jgi:hypothetical protein